MRSARMLLLIVVAVATVLLPGSTTRPQPGGLTSYEEQLRTSTYQLRMLAAQRLETAVEIPASERVDLLLDAFLAECQNPFSHDIADEAYMTITEVLKRRYVFAMRSIGPPALARTREACASATGEIRDNLIVALGFLGEDGLGPELTRILTSSRNGFLRTSAAALLGRIGYAEAIPALKAAMWDKFSTIPKGCVRVPGFNEVAYPVANEAAAALVKLGVDWEEAMAEGPPTLASAESVPREVPLHLHIGTTAESVEMALIDSDGTGYLPLSSICERLGVDIYWDADSQCLVGRGGGREIPLLDFGPPTLLGGDEEQVVVPARIVGGQLLVPIDFLAYEFGRSLVWDPTVPAAWVSAQVVPSPGDVAPACQPAQ